MGFVQEAILTKKNMFHLVVGAVQEIISGSSMKLLVWKIQRGVSAASESDIGRDGIASCDEVIADIIQIVGESSLIVWVDRLRQNNWRWSPSL